MTGMDERAGAPARPHALSNSIYSPRHIKVLGEAFDAAWEHLATNAGTTPQSTEAARLRLAETILRLAHTGDLNARELKESALKRLTADVF
jgi:hypothetical protein